MKQFFFVINLFMCFSLTSQTNCNNNIGIKLGENIDSLVKVKNYDLTTPNYKADFEYLLMHPEFIKGSKGYLFNFKISVDNNRNVDWMEVSAWDLDFGIKNYDIQDLCLMQEYFFNDVLQCTEIDIVEREKVEFSYKNYNERFSIKYEKYVVKLIYLIEKI